MGRPWYAVGIMLLARALDAELSLLQAKKVVQTGTHGESSFAGAAHQDRSCGRHLRGRAVEEDHAAGREPHKPLLPRGRR